MAQLEIALDPGLSPDSIRPVFARTGRLHIPMALQAPAAEGLCRGVMGQTPWRRSIFAGDRGVTLTPTEMAALSAADQATLTTQIMQRARDGFQYTFDSWSVSDEIEAGRRTGHPAEAFYDYINGPDFLDWMRRMTGEPRAAYCDAQCTRYRPGDFLNAHTDTAPGKDRLFAYVMNLSPGWTADWGGLLLFIDSDGHIAEGYTPSYNALNIFKVPQPHLVSMVAPFAGGDRLAITGWIHASRP